MRSIYLLLAVWGFFTVPTSGETPTFEPLITATAGDWPVLLSAPHGGRVPIPGIAERSGQVAGKPVERFVTVRDGNVDEIARLTAAELQQTRGRRPYLVIARFERKFVDANRAPEAAYEHETAKRHYDAYHRAIQDALAEIKQNWGKGLLVDIHGQSKTPDGIYRGTADGEAVSQLVKQHGRAAVVGEKSLFGMFAKQGYRVLPGNQDRDQVEHFFNGGHITRSYGSHRIPEIDAIQVEYGDDFRRDTRIPRTARDLAAALGVFADAYLPDKKLPASATAR